MNRRMFLQSCGIASAAAVLPASSADASFSPRNAAVKPVVGSWFEFEHHNQAEGKYWNSVVSQFTT